MCGHCPTLQPRRPSLWSYHNRQFLALSTINSHLSGAFYSFLLISRLNSKSNPVFEAEPILAYPIRLASNGTGPLLLSSLPRSTTLLGRWLPDCSHNTCVSPKWCPQLFLTLIFYLIWVFNLIIQSKNIKKCRFGFELRVKFCVLVLFHGLRLF